MIPNSHAERRLAHWQSSVQISRSPQILLFALKAMAASTTPDAAGLLSPPPLLPLRTVLCREAKRPRTPGAVGLSDPPKDPYALTGQGCTGQNQDTQSFASLRPPFFAPPPLPPSAASGASHPPPSASATHKGHTVQSLASASWRKPPPPLGFGHTQARATHTQPWLRPPSASHPPPPLGFGHTQARATHTQPWLRPPGASHLHPSASATHKHGQHTPNSGFGHHPGKPRRTTLRVIAE